MSEGATILGSTSEPRCPALDFRPIQSHVGVSQELVWINLACGKSNADTGGDDDFYPSRS